VPRARHRAQLSKLALNMIIVSESSAEATRRVRTDRSAPTRNRSSATLLDTRTHGQPAFTQEEHSSDQGVQIRGQSPITEITSPYRAANLVVG
jgi:hypothetical protein